MGPQFPLLLVFRDAFLPYHLIVKYLMTTFTLVSSSGFLHGTKTQAFSGHEDEV
jgi:hypothetical protein